jgi:hypothetical protein
VKIKLQENELTQLMKESVNGKFANLSFGPGWVELNDTQENKWALLRIQEMRAHEDKSA